MLDVAALASYVIYDELEQKKESDRRRKFIIELSKQLAVPQIEERAKDANVYRWEHVQEALKCFGVVSTACFDITLHNT